MWMGSDKFSTDKTNYQGYEAYLKTWVYPKIVMGSTEQGFIIKESGGSTSTYYSDYQFINPSADLFARIGGSANDNTKAGIFYFNAYYTMSDEFESAGARLMFL